MVGNPLHRLPQLGVFGEKSLQGSQTIPHLTPLEIAVTPLGKESLFDSESRLLSQSSEGLLKFLGLLGSSA